MDTDLRNHMLEMTLAAFVAETDGIHPAHALNRVRAALDIAASMDRAPGDRARRFVLEHATGANDRPVSDDTKDLAATMFRLLHATEAEAA